MIDIIGVTRYLENLHEENILTLKTRKLVGTESKTIDNNMRDEDTQVTII